MLISALLLAVSVPVVAPATEANAAIDVTSVPVPAPKVLPPELDLAQRYQGHSVCDPVEKPGITALRKLLLDTYATPTFYSTRACAADPSSEHTEGRALDWMVTKRDPEQRAIAEAFLTWLLAPGSDGTPAVNARRMGIMYIGWDNQIWRGYSPIGWGELKGCNAATKKPKSFDTYCHRNHVHFSMTWDGAAGQTSYWDGTAALDPTCPSTSTAGKTPRIAGPFVDHTLAPAVAFDTRKATKQSRMSTTIGCRATQGTHLDVPLVGRYGIPTTATRVTVHVDSIGSNSPAPIYVYRTNARKMGKPRFTAAVNGSAGADVTLKVGAE